MRDKPWMVVDVMTNEIVGWYETEAAALVAHFNDPVDISYRPGRKGKAKK